VPQECPRGPVLEGRTVLVTGAGRGLGAATARACLAAGARVVLTDLRADLVEATAAELGAGAAALHHDVADERSWAEVTAFVRSTFGGLDGLVNNAGIFSPLPLAGGSVAEFRRSLEVNLTGTFLGIRAFLDLAAAGGSIVNLSSVRGLVSGAGMAAYSAAKFGVRGLTRAAAVELGPRGIRVNAICPGTIESEMSIAAAEGYDWAGYLGRIPLGQAGAPVDIANAACWLLSDAAAYVSGVDLPIDGGVLATGNTPQPLAAGAST
ncbi:MAG TPA: SDR family NAD(P)-dependent oxidoreductase, partial [Acidimicrobiales bacterium]|nr:SDR family NAD(P)-dependent oxidoreductase [Acidimicrobiales bacterium]